MSIHVLKVLEDCTYAVALAVFLVLARVVHSGLTPIQLGVLLVLVGYPLSWAGRGSGWVRLLPPITFTAVVLLALLLSAHTHYTEVSV